MTLDNKPINFDINRNNLFNLIAKQFDTTGSRSFTFRLLKNSIPFDLTGLSVKVGGKKPDGKDIFNSCTIKDSQKGIVELELTTQMQVVAGMLSLELIIFRGSTRLSTIPFEVKVIQSATCYSEVQSSDEFGALNSALDITNKYADKLKQSTEKIELQYANKLNKLSSLISNVANGGFVETNNKLKGASVYLPYREDLNGTFEDNVIKAIDSNCNTIEICPMFWMSSSTSNSIDGLKAGLTKEYVLEKCKYVKNKGAKVLLKPHVTGEGFNSWGSINPTDVTAWINSYSELLLEIVDFCKDYIDLVSITNECKGQTNKGRDLWIKLINGIKSNKSNLLVLNAMTFKELESCVFLDYLDLIGINMYVPVIGNLNTPIEIQRASLFKESDYINEMLKYSRKLNKKIIITEVGILPFERALQNPEAWGFNDNPPLSFNTQVRYYNLTIKEYLHSSIIQGVMVWNMCDGYSFIDRPAQQTLKEIFGGYEDDVQFTN